MDRDGKHELGERDTTPPDDRDYASTLSALEDQLSQLDRLGSWIAAAHVDAAIQQLRQDRAAQALGVPCSG